MGLSSHRERCDCSRARVGEEDVDVTMFLFHDGIEPVQIFQARHVPRDRRNVSPDICWPVAKPIPLLPPVITAIFPANFCPLLLLICFPFVFVLPNSRLN